MMMLSSSSPKDSYVDSGFECGPASPPDDHHLASIGGYGPMSSHFLARNQTNQPPPMSRTHQYRKVMKPLLERKRRARINKCLDELKDIMVTALQSEGESISKLEKADVLELTVKHLHKLKQQNALGLTPQATYVGKFRAGYTHCAQEVSKFMSQATPIDSHVSTRLLSHLGGCIQALEMMPPSAFSPPEDGPLSVVPLGLSSPPAKMDDHHPESLEGSFKDDQALDLSAKTPGDEDIARRRQLSRDSDSGNSSLGSHEENNNHHHPRLPPSDSDKSWRPW
eukprot:snap_masked-scaffold43_size480169-processed-gene-1.9 protein:Tk12724 transcript:snap_masked-scaffold43_size480169-processed-gene-1.9-mRNA-1 annotation:"enhancer of split mgamma"